MPSFHVGQRVKGLSMEVNEAKRLFGEQGKAGIAWHEEMVGLLGTVAEVIKVDDGDHTLQVSVPTTNRTFWMPQFMFESVTEPTASVLAAAATSAVGESTPVVAPVPSVTLAAASPAGAVPNRMLPEHDSEVVVKILPTTKWEDIHPERSCVDELRNIPLIRERVPDIDTIADDVQLKVQELRFDDEAEEMMLLLDDDEAAGIVAYSHDLNLPGGKKAGNLYFEENRDMRKRDLADRAKMMRTLGPHVYYTLQGLGKLSDFEGTVFRGTPDKDSVIREYKEGRPIQWGAWTSTTMLLAAAKGFTGTQGLIFRIKVFTGKDIGRISFFPTENEILLSPNHWFMVTRASYEEDGYCFVDLMESRGNAYIS